MCNTTLNVDLMREFKMPSAQLDLRQNDLIEEAIRDLIEYYKNNEEHVVNGYVTHKGQELERSPLLAL